MNWLESARLGMFVRWGHSSMDEWKLSLPSVGSVFDLPSCRDLAKYHFNADHFNPIAYNPRQWATIAKSLGVEYVILTVKHHDGFTLFPTKTDDFYFNGDDSDLVKQFVEAMREANLKVGFYFSLVNWHHPAFTEEDKLDYFNQFFQSTLQQWSSCCDVMFEQIRETISVRDMPINRIESVKILRSDLTLAYTQRCSAIDRLTQPDKGELIITVPESIIDPLATVIAISLAPSTSKCQFAIDTIE